MAYIVHSWIGHIAHILNDTIAHLLSSPECDGKLGCDDMENLEKLIVTQGE